MNRIILVLVVAGCSNGVPRVDTPDSGDPHGSDAGTQTSGCMSDPECGTGQVCVNCDGVGKCAPGCRDNSQCGPRDICQLGTVCQTCPCAPGWCVIDPCRDDDNDGYVPGDDATVTCPGKQKGDCDDRAPDVHPNAPELCTNYRDDDCDGKYDERDSDCTCPMNEQRCTTSWDCGNVGGTQCNKGCCQPCNDGAKPTCSFNNSYCATRYGTNPISGCSYGWTCDTCGSCPSTVAPVCGENGSTYDNACLLGLRGTRKAHDGACTPGEGMYCEGAGQPQLDGGCGPSGELYCRHSCPAGTSCGASVCTKKGACLIDADCPAGLASPVADCDGGTQHLRCVNSACVAQCQ